MPQRVIIKHGTYYDSVSLMRISSQVQGEDGVRTVSAVIGTDANKRTLEDVGFAKETLADAGNNDLIIAVDADSEEAVTSAAETVERLLAGTGKEDSGDGQRTVRTLDAALKELDGANLALISTPGKFAAREARRALQRGLHVMVFSDNVPLDQEVALKQAASEKGLLCMGPDCGTAILDGVPLAFANRVRRGRIGLVGASGTGLQEVSTLIHRQGPGISHAIGTGGRDLSDDVGGLTMLQGIDYLDKDADTDVITLISKPPGKRTTDRLFARIRELNKPCVAYFLGVDPSDAKEAERHGVRVASTADEAVDLTVSLVPAGQTAQGAATPGLGDPEDEIRPALERQLSQLTGRSKGPDGAFYLRGLFSGGTLCLEALLTLEDSLGSVYSNLSKTAGMHLEDPTTSREHTLIDMGEDFFTESRPHPMIDPSYRLERIHHEARQREVGLILFDVVLGYNAHPDPAGAVAGPIASLRDEFAGEGRYVAFVASVTGTDDDPQVRRDQVAKLEEAGVLVMSTNHRAAVLASRLLEAAKEGRG